MKLTLSGLLAVLFLGFPLLAFAEAGSTLRTYKDSTVLEQGRKRPEEIQYQKVAKPDKETDVARGPEVFIRDFKVLGVTSLSPAEVVQALAPYQGRDLTTAQIHEAADALMGALRAAGLFTAKVYIPPQNIVDGRVTFRVIEGRLARDGIILQRSSQRMDDDVILGQLRHTLEPGSVITSDKYERAIYLTNDLPGIKGTRNVLAPAQKVGEAAFLVTPEDKPPVTGDVYFDNFGSDYTGRNRGGASLTFNSPTGRGEMLSAGGNVSNLGTVYGYLDCSLLIYPNGLRGGATLDYLDYRTDQVYNLKGSGYDASLYLYYPVIRSRLKNLYAQFQYTHSAFLDKNDLSTITDRVLNVFSLALHGDSFDSFLGGGVTTFRLEGYGGDVDLDNYRPFQEYDAQHADTQGSFARATLTVTRLQHLIGNLQAYLAFNGQIASKRMDPAQSISFGGPYSFPGYHANDIFGDHGWMLHSDLRYNFNYPPWDGSLQVSAFYDYGWITSHTVAIVGGFPVPGAVDNSYCIQSVGFGLSQIWEHFRLQGILGWIVANDIPDELLDDNGKDNYQGWLRLTYIF